MINSGQNFINTITNPNTNYLLPEYVTGLLLSRNVQIVFRGISVLQSAQAIQFATSDTLTGSGRFGFWKASVSGSFTNFRPERTFSAVSESDGLSILIPGAQIIGYFTQVMPQFPPD